MNILFETADPAGAMGGMSMLIMMVAVIGAFWFFMMRPQRKKEKAEKEMRANLQVGDEIITIGGIVGRIVTIKEDSLIVETGADRSKIRIKRWAIASNETIHDD